MTSTPGGPPHEGEEPGRGDEHASGAQDEGPGYWERQAQDEPTAPYARPDQGLGPAYPTTPGAVQYAPDHPRATMSLVLGILGLVLCGLIAPFAWVVGRKTLFEIEDSGGRLGGRSAAQAGYILGIVGTVLLVIGVVVLVLYIAGMAALFNVGMASNL